MNDDTSPGISPFFLFLFLRESLVQIPTPHLVSLLAAACIVQRDNVQEGDQGLPECFYEMHQKWQCVLKVMNVAEREWFLLASTLVSVLQEASS